MASAVEDASIRTPSEDELKLLQAQWTKEQDELAARAASTPAACLSLDSIQRVAGTDISFVKGSDVSVSCIAVTTGPPEHTLVWCQTRVVHICVPYIPGFLAFREVQPLLDIATALREECAARAPSGAPCEAFPPGTSSASSSAGGTVVTWRHASLPLSWPDVVLVDGNGALHPRGFGLACHLGTLLETPTIGVGKSLLAVDGLSKAWLATAIQEAYPEGKLPHRGASVALEGQSGTVHGAAVRLGTKGHNPTFISVGFGVSLESAVEVAVGLSKHRVPEAIRQADHAGRERVRLGLEDVDSIAKAASSL